MFRGVKMFWLLIARASSCCNYSLYHARGVATGQTGVQFLRLVPYTHFRFSGESAPGEGDLEGVVDVLVSDSGIYFSI